jgi:hypothetical protein
MVTNIPNIKFIKNSPKNYWENIIQHNSNKYEQLSSIDKFKNNKIHIAKSQNNKNNKNNAKNNDDIKQTCIDIQLILKKYIKINKKERVNVYDCIYLVAYKLINNHSYQDVSDDLFCSEGIFLGNDKISKKLNNINSDILLKINDELVHYIKNIFKPIHLLKSTIKSIDGSDLCADIGLSKHGYDKTDTHRYSTVV